MWFTDAKSRTVMQICADRSGFRSAHHQMTDLVRRAMRLLVQRVGIDIYGSLLPNSFQDDHRAVRLGPLKAETGVRFP
jgi:hypothetical protein